MVEVSEYIKQKRESLNISSRKLSEIAGISSTEMMKIERGERKTPSWSVLCKIAKGINVHPFDILCVAGYISENDINPILRITGTDELNEDGLKMVQHFIDFTLAQQAAQGGKKNDL